MNSLRWSLLLCVAFVATVHAARREESVLLFENRQVVIAVPTGFAFGSTRDDLGLVRVQLNSRNREVTVQLTFLPDVEGRFGDGYERRKFLHDSFSDFVDNSVEKTMAFEELEPVVGAGTYCVFTDAALVGKDKYPPGEYLHATQGAKAWPGVLAVFSILSNDTTSAEYRAVLDLLRQSVVEKPVPLR